MEKHEYKKDKKGNLVYSKCFSFGIFLEFGI